MLSIINKALSPFAAGIAALCALLLLTVGVLSWQLDRKQLKLERVEHLASNMIAASKRLIAANERFSKASKENARETDKQDTDLRVVWRDRIMHIPAASRECPAAESGTATSPVGPSGDSILFPRADALICATNTSRLIASHNWAIELQALQEAELSGIY